MSKWTDQEIALLKELYPKSGIACASAINRSKTAIMDKVSHLQLHHPRKRNLLNKALFLHLDTAEIAYTLGVIWADGCLPSNSNSISLTMLSSDIEELMPVLKKVGNWGSYIRKHPRWQEATTVHAADKDIATFLKSVGYRNKSFDSACKILELIPQHLHKYWWRGIIDGDGNFNEQNGSRSFSLSSSQSQDWTFAENLCKRLDLPYSIYTKNQLNKRSRKVNRCSLIVVHGYFDIRTLYNYVYDGMPEDHIGMTRKYDYATRMVANFPKSIRYQLDKGIQYGPKGYSAKIALDGQKYDLGYHPTFQAAVAARKTKIIEYGGAKLLKRYFMSDGSAAA